MSTFLGLQETPEAMQTEAQREAEAIVPGECEPIPDPEWVRGRCPECGAPLVSNMEYIDKRGYLLRWLCWNSLRDVPTCTYYKVP